MLGMTDTYQQTIWKRKQNIVHYTRITDQSQLLTQLGHIFLSHMLDNIRSWPTELSCVLDAALRRAILLPLECIIVTLLWFWLPSLQLWQTCRRARQTRSNSTSITSDVFWAVRTYVSHSHSQLEPHKLRIWSSRVTRSSHNSTGKQLCRNQNG